MEDGFRPGRPPGASGRFRSFAASYIAYRALFAIVWTLFANWTPAPLHGWRRLVLRAFGAKLARTARVFPFVRIMDPHRLRMGEHAVLSRHVTCFNVGADIILEDHADVAWGATLITANHDIDHAEFQAFGSDIVIGSHAWIAAQACVGPGVKVGEGAVLSAWGVAFRDLEPWTVYYGNPATKIRRRRRFLEQPDADA